MTDEVVEPVAENDGTGEVHFEQLQSLADVEIFRTGEWNGDKYTETDLDEMVANFGKVGYEVPVKLGHSEESGEPAYGWVTSLRRVGDRLIADLRDIPTNVYEWIKDRRFDAVSSEIFWNLKRGGKKFRRALKAVALLGAETPGVAGLKPLRESLRGFSDAELRALRVYTLSKDMENMTDNTELKELAQRLGLAEDATQEDVDAKVKELTEQAAKAKELEAELAKARADEDAVKILTAQVAEMKARERKAEIERKVEALKVPSLREHFRVIYDVADDAKTVKFTVDGKASDKPLVEVIDGLVALLNGGVGKLFKELSTTEVSREEDVKAENPSAEVDRLTKLHIQAHPGTKYVDALHAVLSDPQNAELKVAYAKVS